MVTRYASVPNLMVIKIPYVTPFTYLLLFTYYFITEDQQEEANLVRLNHYFTNLTIAQLIERKE